MSTRNYIILALSLMVTLIVGLSPVHHYKMPNHLAWHTIIEMTCVMVGLMIFLLQFILSGQQRVGRFHVLGGPFLGIAILDFFHTFSYRGLPDFFTPNSLQKSITLWLAARWLEAITFLFFACITRWQINRKLPIGLIYGLTLVYVGAALIWTFGFPEWVPAFTGEFDQLTPLKRLLEYLLLFVHVVIVALLMHRMNETDERRSHLIMASCLIAISGISFAWFSSESDVVIFTGHFFKLYAYGYIFRACLLNELVDPFLKMVSLSDQLRHQTLNVRSLQSQILSLKKTGPDQGKLAEVIHDINNMLSVSEVAAGRILEIASQTHGNESLLRYSQAVVNSLKKTKSYQKMLISQPQEDQLEALPPLDLSGLLLELRPLIDALIGGHARLNLKSSGNHLHPLHPVEFEQVIMNLVTNAKDAVTSGAGEIDIDLKEVEMAGTFSTIEGNAPGGAYSVLTIKDNGAGISRDDLHQVFDLHFTTKASKGGSGIGLNTVRTLVEGWGGLIQIDSEQGKGTSIRIFIPKATVRS